MRKKLNKKNQAPPHMSHMCNRSIDPCICMDWLTFKTSIEAKLLQDSHCKDPKSNYIFYFESIMFDKMLERKFINFISDLTTLLIIFFCSVFSWGLETVKLGKVY